MTVLSKALLALVATASLAEAQDPFFRDASEDYGVLFQHEGGVSTFGMAGGVAWLDYDGDGDEDLFCTSGDSQHRLMRCEGSTFSDATLDSNLPRPGSVSNFGVSVADYDQDGRPDIYLTNGGANSLMRNMGGGAFEDQAPALGVDGDQWSMSASWADFDLDGDLDLYVGNYLEQIAFPYHIGDPNNLYINDGTPGGPAFIDRAAELGVDNRGFFTEVDPELENLVPFPPPLGQPTAGCTLSVATPDYDEDGDPDLMVGNDFGDWVLSDRLYRNDVAPDQPLSFRDISDDSGFDQRPLYNMGINGADYDHDGDWDYYLSNLGDNVLLEMGPNGRFADSTYSAGPVEGTNPENDLLLTSWGTIWADFDNDGWEDLVVVNGYIPAAPFITNDEDAPNALFLNQKDGTFLRVDDALSGLDDPGSGRGIGATDVNKDGLIDFYIMNTAEGGIGLMEDRCRLYINEGGDPDNGWIRVLLEGYFSNTEGIGARVDLEVGSTTLKRQVLADAVYLSAGTRSVHFGIGKFARAQRMIVEWPSGIRQELYDVRSESDFVLAEPRLGIRKIEGPYYEGDALQLGAGIENLDDVPHDYRVVFQLLHDPSSGYKSIKREVTGTLAPHSKEKARVAIGVPGSLQQQTQGLDATLRVTVIADGASNARTLEFPLP